MNHLHRFFLIISFALISLFSFGLSAMAQSLEEVPIDFSVLKDLGKVSKNLTLNDSNDSKRQYLVMITNKETDSRFEVYANKLEDISQAANLFSIFETTLTDAQGFVPLANKLAEKELTLNNDQKRVFNNHAFYKFNTEMPIIVEEYTFTTGQYAFAVFGYYSEEGFESDKKLLEDLLKTMVDLPAAQ
jgi:hypothetical protein